MHTKKDEYCDDGMDIHVRRVISGLADRWVKDGPSSHLLLLNAPTPTPSTPPTPRLSPPWTPISTLRLPPP